MSAAGYPDSGMLARTLLVVTHVAMVPSLAIAWRCRQEVPWVFISIFLSLVASSHYHMCYSFSVCAVHNPHIARKADHVASLMIVPALLTMFLWVRPVRCIPSRSGPPIVRMSADAARTRTAMDATRDPLPSAPPTDRLVYVRPAVVEPAILVLYILALYLQAHIGMDAYEAPLTLLLAVAASAAAHATEAVSNGMSVRLGVLAAVLVPLGMGCVVFKFDDEFGAFGHAAWHTLGFISIYVYMRWGPVLVAADNTWVSVRTGAPPTLRVALDSEPNQPGLVPWVDS